jgi:hypothetical protein
MQCLWPAWGRRRARALGKLAYMCPDQGMAILRPSFLFLHTCTRAFLWCMLTHTHVRVRVFSERDRAQADNQRLCALLTHERTSGREEGRQQRACPLPTSAQSKADSSLVLESRTGLCAKTEREGVGTERGAYTAAKTSCKEVTPVPVGALEESAGNSAEADADKVGCCGAEEGVEERMSSAQAERISISVEQRISAECRDRTSAQDELKASHAPLQAETSCTPQNRAGSRRPAAVRLQQALQQAVPLKSTASPTEQVPHRRPASASSISCSPTAGVRDSIVSQTTPTVSQTTRTVPLTMRGCSDPQPSSLNSQSSGSIPQPSTPNPQPSTLKALKLQLQLSARNLCIDHTHTHTHTCMHACIQTPSSAPDRLAKDAKLDPPIYSNYNSSCNCQGESGCGWGRAGVQRGSASSGGGGGGGGRGGGGGG